MISIRGKSKVQNAWTQGDFYKDYIKDKDKDSPYYVTSTEFFKICNDYFDMVTDQIIFDNVKFKLPSRMGYVYLVKKKKDPILAPNRLPIDWVLTNKYGKLIKRLNPETGGYTYFIKWFASRHTLPSRHMYVFKTTRLVNRLKLAKGIQSGIVDCTEINEE